MARVKADIEVGTVSADLTLDLNDGFTLLRLAGFEEEQIDLAQAVVEAESGWYGDAVGDVSLISAKWGPSIGLFQIRALRSPTSFGAGDYWRYNALLTKPLINCMAAFEMSKGGTDWSAWSTFNSGSYKDHLGAESRTVKTGHTRAAQWWI